jgi:prolyl 4-hydroxylase
MVTALVFVGLFAGVAAALLVTLLRRRPRAAGCAAAAHAPGLGMRLGEHTLTVVPISARRPLLQLVENFLTPAECAELLAQAGEGAFTPSTTLEGLHSSRTSSTKYLDRAQTPLVARIEERAAALARLPSTHIEPMQLTRYRGPRKSEPGQRYDPHFDWFEPGSATFAKGTDHGYRDAAGAPVPNQRALTIFVYLTEPDPEELACSGGTVFPELGGLEVVPRAGSAALFSNLDELGRGDSSALHGGLPNRCPRYVKTGLNIWFRRFPWPWNLPAGTDPATYLHPPPPASLPACAVPPGLAGRLRCSPGSG